jgi:hypothetical protein
MMKPVDETWRKMSIVYFWGRFCESRITPTTLSTAPQDCDFFNLSKIKFFVLSSLYVCMAIKYIIVLFVETPRKLFVDWCITWIKL